MKNINFIKYIINKLNNVRKTYEDEYMNSNLIDKILLAKLLNENIKKAKVDYIDFIINEINKITDIIEIEYKPDMQYECMYYGSNILYITEKFKEYSEIEKLEIVLNHIFHYCGQLFIINNEYLQKAYIKKCLNICFNDKEKHIIFPITQTYKNFILKNIKYIPFLKEKFNSYIGYRIEIGKIIKFKGAEFSKTLKLLSDNINPQKEFNIFNFNNV